MTDEDREAFRRINENLNRLRAAAPRHRMPDPLPMSLAPRDGTPVLVCGVVYREIGEPDNHPSWTKARFNKRSQLWDVEPSDTYGMTVHDPLGWLPVPEVLTAPVPEKPPIPQAPIVPIGVHKPPPVCWLCRGFRVTKVFRGEPSQGHDWEPCEVCSPATPPPERHKPLPYPEEDA